MKNKKLVVLLSIFFFSFSLVGCSGERSTQSEANTTMSDEVGEEKKEETETTKESETTKEPETTKESENYSETETVENKEQVDNTKTTNTETKDNKTSESPKETKQQEESKQAETTPAPAPHTHNYTSNVTANPTCTNNGVKTYVCSCGDSYQEAIPAVGHNWTTQYKEVYHEAQGEMQQVQVGEEIWVQCRGCGAEFTGDDAYEQCSDHCFSSESCAFASYFHDRKPIYENQWVVTQEAYTEQVPYNVCATCGATQ